MSDEKNHIVVFEHATLRWDKTENKITKDQFLALEKYFGEKGVPYFSLCYNGVRFNEHVGVIQVGKTLYEVLPKADKDQHTKTEEVKWRNILIGMLNAVGSFDIRSTSESNLKIKSNTILDLYFEIFIQEVEYLFHTGLVKKYRKKEGNVTALKGSLQFGKHIQQNLTHQERFYVRHTTYDVEHKLHYIFYKTIQLLKQINTNAGLQSRIGSLLLNFPEMPDIKVTESTFDKIVYNRKTQAYKKAIEISRLLLLQYHPDVSKGRNNVLALMFDMNKLWEKFVFVSLRKDKTYGRSVHEQTPKYFWQPQKGNRSRMQPDIVINKDCDDCIVLDTKWKNLDGYNPSPEDLRQLFAYQKYFGAKKVALVYPGSKSDKSIGNYIHPLEKTLMEECSAITISVETQIRTWQEQICSQVNKWITRN